MPTPPFVSDITDISQIVDWSAIQPPVTPVPVTLAPLPTAVEVATELLQYLFATTGTPTDYNKGSIIRTYSEAIGSVSEIEGIELQAGILQALVYSAYAAFGITPNPAAGSVGTATFSTLSSAPLPSGQSVLIPVNTIVQTLNGIQFGTTSAVILLSGTPSVDAPIQSLLVGSFTNVLAGAIQNISSSVAYPLAVSNSAPTVGGTDAETPAETLARFLAFVYSLGLCTPTAIAAAPIGRVKYLQETVKFCSVTEPWVSQISGGSLTPTPGFTVYIDNGSGSATTNLIAATTTFLNSGPPAGYRPSGVPFAVSGVVPINCSVQITATALDPTLDVVIQTAITSAVNGYFAGIGFTTTVQLNQIIAIVSDVSYGLLTGLSVTLLNHTSTSVSQITAGLGQRVIMTSLSVTVN